MQRPSGGPGQDLQKESLSPSPSSGVIPRVLLSALARYTRVTPRTCHLPALCLSYRGCPNPRSAAPGASAEKRSEKAATLGSRRRETRCGPRGRTCDVSVLLGEQHLFLPPVLLQTHIHSRSPFRADLTTASKGSRCGVPRLSNPGSNLSAWAPECSRDGEVATNFLGPSPPPLPTSRAGGGRRKEEMDRGRMLSLLAIRRGTFPLPQPTPPGTFLPAQLRGAQRGFLSLFPFASFGLFGSPFLFQEGSY